MHRQAQIGSQTAARKICAHALVWVVASMLGGLSLGGCSSDDVPPLPDLMGTQKTKAKPAKAVSAPPKEATKEEAPVATFTYSPVGKRDPFRSYLETLNAEKERLRRQRKLEPTEEFELDQLTLTGLISGTSQPRALFEDPTGSAHVLKIGSRLGKNGGRIVRISNVGVQLVEEYRAPTGERVKVPIDIKLPHEEIILKNRL